MRSPRKSIGKEQSPSSQPVGSTGGVSPTMSIDSGLGECTTQQFAPWIDDMTRIGTGRDIKKHINDSEEEKW